MNEKAQLDEKLRFFEAAERCRSERDGGIGTLGEKTLHAVIKSYIEPDGAKHEIPLSGSVADVVNERGIFEVQTRGFDRLRPKLARFISETELDVTIVHPIAHNKRLIWMDPMTGEMTAPRKSPKTGGFLDAFRELYRLSALISEERLSILLLLVDMDEYKLLNGYGPEKKRRAERFERMPTGLYDAVLLRTCADYAALLPPELEENFTSAQLAKTSKLSRAQAGDVLRVMVRVGALRVSGRHGRSNLYARDGGGDGGSNGAR